MAAKNEPSNPPERTIVLTRLLDAPRALVFRAWTDPNHMAKWWGPKAFTTPVCEMDVRPGGALRVVMRGPDGVEYPMTGAFREIAAPERLVFTFVAWDAAGHRLLEGTTAVTFAEQDGQTKLTVQSTAVGLAVVAPQMLAGMETGWAQSLERLADLVADAAGRELVITRVFDAPRELVFKAWTEAERLKHWWGPKGFTMHVCQLDLRPGGVFHYSMRSPEGREMWGRFVYREVVPPERIVFVNSFSDEAGGITRNPWLADWPLEVLNTATFEEREGRTTLTLRGVPVHATEAERKAFECGRESMRKGFAGTLKQLADFLAHGPARSDTGETA